MSSAWNSELLRHLLLQHRKKAGKQLIETIGFLLAAKETPEHSMHLDTCGAMDHDPGLLCHGLGTSDPIVGGGGTTFLSMNRVWLKNHLELILERGPAADLLRVKFPPLLLR